MKKILYNDTIKANYHTTNREYLDLKERKNIKCKIYQLDDGLIIFKLGEEEDREITLDIKLNLKELGDEEVVLTYVNPKLPYVRYPKIVRRSSNPIE
jgi:hypothetical protein